MFILTDSGTLILPKEQNTSLLLSWKYLVNNNLKFKVEKIRSNIEIQLGITLFLVPDQSKDTNRCILLTDYIYISNTK